MRTSETWIDQDYLLFGGEEGASNPQPSLNITGEHVVRLYDGAWLNSELISLAMNQLVRTPSTGIPGSLCCTYFAAMLSGSRDLARCDQYAVNFMCKVLVIPMNIDNVHWVLVVIDSTSGTIATLNSLEAKKLQDHVLDTVLAWVIRNLETRYQQPPA